VNLEKYRALFIEEAGDHLAEMSRAVVALERHPSAGEAAAAVDSMFRMAHSIKGMAASLDYDAISALAHRLEDWLEPLRAGAEVSDAGFEVMYEALGALEEMVAQVASGGLPQAREDLIAGLASCAPHSAARRAAPAAPASGRVAGPPPPRAGRRTVRVRTDAIDRFLAAVGEVMQRHSRLEALYRSIPLWHEHREFSDELDHMEHVVRELRRRALDVRTTPLRRTLERLPRVAMELGRELGRRVAVEVSGEEVEVDCAVLDHLDDPLLHLVRNAVDHGIESPAEREAAGKDPVGHLRVVATRVPGRVRIRIEEDGRGIDVERVRRRAIARGLLPEAVAEDLPADRVCEMIFEPGISTRDQVTEVSGRGVGLDAVRRALQALGGTISVESVEGRGTAFEIELPSIVALQQIMVLEVAGERVALPLAQVKSVLALDEGVVEGVGPDAFFVWREEPIPLLALGPRLGLPVAQPEGKGTVVVLEPHGFRLGLCVDRAQSQLEVFVREVPPALAPRKLLGGVAILPDGDPVFLLEVAALTLIGEGS
jgi:two-component system chemotaxis sensor kinase CheA